MSESIENDRAALLVACQFAFYHVEELREAWRTGAIDERDGLGGTRSNRNIDAETMLRSAILQATGNPPMETRASS